ncbi:unnamed protein product [Vitrella brassicaformis CCMP3155]|uniref:Glyceraldehyde 3-phosphate dehydrogenase catalytic domain-containing protein n=1 Tax=Vitrella brassicaformis (strain CCMP3155) TaxID=1169540 RepID=A0A0G4GJE6_VITBC|nr:unnamed protein product [Vitrella brassicaformis CCMP3155]|eukprot:CEM29893.1 unnamed protein product [Vitrella brassicaformis CCMP3155]
MHTPSLNVHAQGVLRVTSDYPVSRDIVCDKHSCIFDEKAFQVVNDTTFMCTLWYDNEWGYANRVVDSAMHMAKVDGILVS